MNKPIVRAVIFDVGGVLLRTQDHGYRHRWDDRLGLHHGQIEEMVFNSEAGQKAQRGEISDEELWAWIAEELSLGDQAEAFRRDFWAGDVMDNDLVDAIRALRPAYQTAVISNATDALRETLSETYGIADAFDLIVGSAEEKVMKPSPVIYERALAALGRQAEEAVFIDDFARNVQAARALGMAAIHYRPGTDVVAELAKLSVSATGVSATNDKED